MFFSSFKICERPLGFALVWPEHHQREWTRLKRGGALAEFESVDSLIAQRNSWMALYNSWIFQIRGPVSPRLPSMKS